MTTQQPKYPGIPDVIHGNGAVAHVMRHVCGGVIGYPITPSTEISELYEAARAEGGVSVWGRHPFFFEPEGEHSAQSGALGAALTGGQFISNASSSQGILYAMESHFVTVGKKIGGFVLQVAARVVSKHSLNVMAGHDDIYALLPSGYTVLFGADPQEAADLAAISYRTSALSLIPVANAMDGFSTSHMMSEARLPEPELLREYLGDPAGRIPCPTVAQELLFGAKGRVFQLEAYLTSRETEFAESDLVALHDFLAAHADDVERDNEGHLVEQTVRWVPETLRRQWRRQWVNAHEKGTRQMVPALVDIHNPGMTGPVQNQPDFQAGAADHRTHFASAVPDLVRQAMREYSELTGREYAPVRTVLCEDAEHVMVGLGSVTEDVEAVLPYLRSQGLKVGLVAVKLLQPFPEAELAAALAGKKSVMVLERSDQMALTDLVTKALFKSRENASAERYPGIPGMDASPTLTSAIFGLGGHDLQPRHLIAAYRRMAAGDLAPLVYLGTQFFDDDPSPAMADVQARLRAAYPETEFMALTTEPNPRLLPETAMRIRFHSVGGYGTIATGKLLTDILAGVLGMHSKSAPKYGSEKSGAATNYYITLSPEPVKITNAELEDVEIVISPDHKVFSHTDPLKGLADGGTFMLQTSLTPEQVWRELPRKARRTIREKGIRFFIVDAFAVAKQHAPSPELETRMMGIAFIGAVAAHVDRVAAGASREDILEKVRQQIVKKFGRKGEAVVEANMAVIRDGAAVTREVDHDSEEIRAISDDVAPVRLRTVALSRTMSSPSTGCSSCAGLFDADYYERMVIQPFREGTISEAPVLPGTGLFMPPGTAAGKDKGLFRRTVPMFDSSLCTGCMECALVCPDAAIPNTVITFEDMLSTGIRESYAQDADRAALRARLPELADAVRVAFREKRDAEGFAATVAAAAAPLVADDAGLGTAVDALVEALGRFPVARTRAFFDSMEKKAPGAGALFAATIDPWKCTGCLECVDVCGPNALIPHDQDDTILDTLQERFEYLTELPNTPERYSEVVPGPGGDPKRMLLDHDHYYATTGGHGGCRGCGEVTSIRLVTSTSHSITEKRQQRHLAELEDLTAQLADRLAVMAADEPRRARVEQLLATLERRLYLLEAGPTGKGPAGAVVANATGCSSVYASTMPYNPYTDPWVNSLFQDAQPLAKGIFEGIASQLVDDVRALRLARRELAGDYEPARDDAELRYLSWQEFTDEEMDLLPTVLTIGGDGATYDIGFGALSRILTSNTPIKVMVLNSGVYSNTGGQASTSSFTGQDSDLSRSGRAHHGKQEFRKELGLIASFHPNVYVVSTATAYQSHFLKNTLEFLTEQQMPAVMDVYTPCQSEHGVADDAANRRARLAVKSRMNPLFVHDPRRGETIHERFSLDGNPDPTKTWSANKLEYVAEDGSLQLLTTVATPADFALGETRFKSQFRKLRADEEPAALPVHEYIELDEADRRGHVPFVHTTDPDMRLMKMVCSGQMIALVEERRRNWQLLQYLAGQDVDTLTSLHKTQLAELQAKYDEATTARETSLDDIARMMADLADAGTVPAVAGFATPAPAATATASPAQPASAAPAAAPKAPVSLAEEDMRLCTDCKTCYQELPELFEPVRVVVDGEARTVARLIPGALESLEVTPEVEARIKKVIDNCDAEIIK
ncbi:MAG: pyruvate-flavodoxin oxidoreductase [Actinobacteria bacterium]|nr:pyruvate-flavodoxin oxidoreductase [Actinomycetota bacterium]